MSTTNMSKASQNPSDDAVVAKVRQQREAMQRHAALRQKLYDLDGPDLDSLVECVEFAVPHFEDALLDYGAETPEGAEVRQRLAAARKLRGKLLP